MKKPLNEANILRGNPSIDSRVVRDFAELERELQSLGVDVKPRYHLSPPLGDLLRVFVQNAGPARQKESS